MNYVQQAEDFALENGIKLKIKGSTFGKMWDDVYNRYIFKCQLTYNKKSYTFNFGQSLNSGSEPPNMYDVLTCLEKHDPDSFEFLALTHYITPGKIIIRK